MVPISTCWPLNILNNLLGLQSFLLLTLFCESFPINLSVWPVLYLLNDKTFLRYSWKRYEKNAHLFCLERHKLNVEVSQWEKAQLFSSHHLCHVWFPEDLAFKLVLHGFTKEWKPESKQLSPRTSGVKNARKYYHVSNGPC